jgi:hypothetical protein
VVAVFSLNNLATQAKIAEELIPYLTVYIKMMGEEIFNLGVENEALSGKLGEFDG